jgi:hypothetical protein
LLKKDWKSLVNIQRKKEQVRRNIIDSAQVYKEKLVGKHFIYIFGDECFEMYFKVSSFKHLTGVNSTLSAKQFYSLASKGHLQKSQLSFNSRYPLTISIKKTEGLKVIDLFISEELFVIKNLVTPSATYPYALTNLDKSILVVLETKQTSQETYYVPKSFRVKDKNIFDKTHEVSIEAVDFILSKKDVKKKYDTLHMQDKGKCLSDLSETLKIRISDDLIS